MKGYAPGWRVRCTRCGGTRDAADAGIVRVAAWSFKKFVLGKCPACRRWAFLAVEKSPETLGTPTVMK